MQTTHVLAEYASDYFDKELTHVRMQYVEHLRRAVDDLSGSQSKVFPGTILQIPHLKAEKMKSIASIVVSVVNQKFVTGVLAITTDAVLRMEVTVHLQISSVH